MKVVLVIPFYIDKHKVRQEELEFCLLKNLNNYKIDRVIAVCDTEIKLNYSKKLTVINIGRRQTFSDLSNIGNSINPDGINIISNADVFFKKQDIELIKKIDFTNIVLALSRWDIIKNKNPKHYNLKDSQDTWIWKGILKVDGNFNMGQRGIDNRIAYELSKNYTVLNPSNTIKSYHLHLSGLRNYTEKSEAIHPPYLRVPCCYYSDKKIKKVLHIGLNSKGQSELCNMLKSFGEYVFFDWQKINNEEGVLRMREKIIDLNNKFNPDLVFMQIQTPGIIDPITASNLYGFVFNFNGDVREDISWMGNLAAYIDATCLTNETDTETLREEGYNSWFYQIGFESKIFTSEGKKLVTKNTVWDRPDIVFMANHYKDKFPLSQERYDIAKRLKNEYGNKFLLCGQGWDIESINLMGRMKDEAMVYRSCKIAINANHFIHKRFSSDRIFRIMGSGAFCLTRWYPGIEKDFIDGVHLKTFQNIDEMIYLINYYLKHDGERIDIADAGCKLVHEKFKWNKKLFQQIISFPQVKLKEKKQIITTPMTNKEWRKFFKEPL